jgi:hypothetical protein
MILMVRGCVRCTANLMNHSDTLPPDDTAVSIPEDDSSDTGFPSNGLSGQNTWANRAASAFLVDMGSGVLCSAENRTEFRDYLNRKTGDFLSEVCFSLDYDGEWVYYIKPGTGIIKARPDRSEMNLLADGDIHSLAVVDGSVWFTVADGRRLHRMGLDGTGKSPIGSVPVSSFNINDNSVFYIESDSETGGIFSMNTDGSDRRLLLDHVATRLILHEGWLYYISLTSGGTVHRMKPDGSGRTLLIDIPVRFYSVDGNKVYYAPSDKPGLFHILTDNTSYRGIHNDSLYFHDLCIAGDYLWCLVEEEDRNVLYLTGK